MAPWNDEDLPDALQDVARRLREERREATPLELDRIKMDAMLRARARSFAPHGGLRSRLVVVLTTLALVGGAAGGVIAATNAGKSDGKNDNAARKQYQPGKGCGDKNRDHAREDECKKDNDGDGDGVGGNGGDEGKARRSSRRGRRPRLDGEARDAGPNDGDLSRAYARPTGRADS